MSHNCDLSVLVKTVEVTISRAFYRLLRLNSITAGSSTKGLEQIPDDSREQEERKEGKRTGPMVTCGACRAVFSVEKKKESDWGV